MNAPTVDPPKRGAFPQPIVLLVEDDVVVRSNGAEYLRLSGCRVIEAANATEALAILTSASKIDLVFTDFAMPGGLTGLMLADWVAQRFPTLPVLITTGYAEQIPGFAPGQLRRFIPKPYGLAEARQQIEEMLS